MDFKEDFTEICSLWPNRQYGSIGSDNGLWLVQRQAIIWSNVGMLYWRIYASLGLNELISLVKSILWITYKKNDKIGKIQQNCSIMESSTGYGILSIFLIY